MWGAGLGGTRGVGGTAALLPRPRRAVPTEQGLPCASSSAEARIPADHSPPGPLGARPCPTASPGTVRGSLWVTPSQPSPEMPLPLQLPADCTLSPGPPVSCRSLCLPLQPWRFREEVCKGALGLQLLEARCHGDAGLFSSGRGAAGLPQACCFARFHVRTMTPGTSLPQTLQEGDRYHQEAPLMPSIAAFSRACPGGGGG